MNPRINTKATSIAKIAMLSALMAGLTVTACAKKEKILIDGSSTVYPITEAVAEEYRKVNNSVHVTVGVSGTGGGFKKFCNGETAISNASRPIKETEVTACAKAGVTYLKLPVAYDGLAVLVNKSNTFVNELTVEQLKAIFTSENPAKQWKDVNSAWPATDIKVYAPGQDSGTHDYFVETILGKKKKMRSDSSFSEDDNVLVTGIAGDKGSIGFFGLAYYEENKASLKLIPVINPKTKAAVSPSLETVKNGDYYPLSRPIFFYVSKKASGRPSVKAFIKFFMEKGATLASDVGYIPLASELYQKNMEQFGAF